jgi:precorrin-6B methylase 2
MPTELTEMLGDVYNEMEGSEPAQAFSERHGIASAAVLTVTDDETAVAIAEYLAPRIEGKTVVEIGGGIGLLALYMGDIAKRVYCIEANPMWTSVFISGLIKFKQKNVSFLFGAADEFVGCIKADVAVICTHSDVSGMKLIAAQFAPEVIDVYGELIIANPEGFDKLASTLRAMT